jgi:Nucleotide-diphospho-sugar transferase
MHKVDVAAMWDHETFNAGFIIIRPTEHGLRLWDTTCNLTSIHKRVNDQVAFNKAIKQLGGDFQLHRIKAAIFSQSHSRILLSAFGLQ